MGSISKYLGGSGLSGGGSIFNRGRGPQTSEEKEDLTDEEKLELAQQRLSQELGKLRGKWKRDNDNKARIEYEAMLGKYASGVDSKFLKDAGIPESEIDPYKENTGLGSGSDLSWQEKAMGIVGKGAEYAGRPGQAVFRGLQELGIGAYNAAYGSEQRKGEGVLKGMWSGLSGRGPALNTREAFGMDKDTGGTLGDVLDIGGQAALDPLNFISFGTGGAAKAGLRQLGEKAVTRGLLDDTGRRLAMPLARMAAEDQSLIRATLREGVSPAARGEAGLLRRNIMTLGRSGDDAAEYITNQTMKKLARRGRGGLVLAGRTVVPGGKLGKAIGWADRVATSTADLSQGNLQVQGAADDFARGYRSKPLRVIDPENVPKFVVADEDKLAEQTDEIFSYMTKDTGQGGMGLKVEYVDKVEAYDSAADLRADVASGRIKIAAAEGAAESEQMGQVVKEQAIEDVFGRALSGTEDDNVAKAYVAQLYTDDAMKAADPESVAALADDAAPARTLDEVRTEQGQAAEAKQAAADAGDDTAFTREAKRLDDLHEEEARIYAAQRAGGEAGFATLTGPQQAVLRGGITGRATSHFPVDALRQNGIPPVFEWVDEAGNATPEFEEFFDDMRAVIDDEHAKWTEKVAAEPDNANFQSALDDFSDYKQALDTMEPQVKGGAPAAAAPAAPSTMNKLIEAERKLAEAEMMKAEVPDVPATSDPSIRDLIAESDEINDELGDLYRSDPSSPGVADRMEELEARLEEIDDRIAGGGKNLSDERPALTDLSLSSLEEDMLQGYKSGSIHPFYEIKPNSLPATPFAGNRMDPGWYEYLVTEGNFDEYLDQFDELQRTWQSRLDRIESGETLTDVPGGRNSRGDAQAAVDGIPTMKGALEQVRDFVREDITHAAPSGDLATMREEVAALREQVAKEADEAERAARVKTPRGAAEVAGEEKIEQKRVRIVEGKRRRLVKADEKVEKAEARLDATRAKIEERLEADPNTPTFGMGRRLGEAGKRADEAAAEEIRASARAERANKKVSILEARAEKARARLTEVGGDLQEQELDTAAPGPARDRIIGPEVPVDPAKGDAPGVGGPKPGFRGGKKLGKAEERAAQLEAALKEARVERGRLDDAAHAAREASWDELDRYNKVVESLRGKGRKPVKGFGEGKKMEKGERALRDARKAQAKAESAMEDATERWEDLRPTAEAAVKKRGDRAAREAALGNRSLLAEDEMGEAVSATGATPLRQTELVKRGARRKILESRVGGVLNRAVNTRADVRFRPGSEGLRLADQMGDVAPQVAGLYRDHVEPVIRRLSELVRTAKVDSDTLTEMYDVLEEGGDAVGRKIADVSWPPASRVGNPDAARKLLGEMDKARHDFTQALVDAGVTDAGLLDNVDRYVHRTLTKAGMKALGDVGRGGEGAWAKAGRYGTDLAQGGALEERTFLKDLTVAEIEADPRAATVRRRAGLVEGEALYERDPVVQTARRTASAYGAVAEVENYRLLSNIKTDAGEQLMVVARKSDKKALTAATLRAKRLGYTAVPLSDAADVVAWAPEDIVPELIRMRQVVYNDETLREVGKFFDAWNRLWKRSATIPLTSGTGFAMRNMQGNFINNYLRGVTSLDVYRQAGHFQNIEKRANKLARTGGLSFEKALDELGVVGRDRELALLARKHGVWSAGFIRADLGADELAELIPSTRGAQLRGHLNPLGQQSGIVKGGRAINEAIENNARMAHFIQKFDELGNAVDAARSMRETLFDYADLTPFEQRFAKRINAFYTWTRKNLPLQMKAWTETPARQHRVMIAEEQLIRGDEEPGDQRYNAFAIDRGQGPANKVLSKLLGGGSNGALVGVDTPFEAALETLNPILQTAAVTPGLSRIVPDDLKPRGGSWSTKAKTIAGNVIGQTAGGPAEALNSLYEMATGVDTFTGQAYVTPQGKVIRTKEEALLSLTSILAPGIGKTVNQVQGLGNMGKYADRPSSMTRSMLARMFIGVAVTPQDERTEKGEMWRRYYEAQEAIQEAFPDGLPTVTELRDSGDFPAAPRRRRVTGGSIFG